MGVGREAGRRLRTGGGWADCLPGFRCLGLEGDFQRVGARPTFGGERNVKREAAMVDKRNAGTGKSKGTVVRRRRTTGGTAGRIAVRRNTAAYRSAAADEHAGQVRDWIEAALAEGRRMRENIEKRIEEGLKEDDGSSVDKILTRLTATARLRALKPPNPEDHGKKGGHTKQGRSSK
jgi:hypothetical protein